MEKELELLDAEISLDALRANDQYYRNLLMKKQEELDHLKLLRVYWNDIMNKKLENENELN